MICAVRASAKHPRDLRVRVLSIATLLPVQAVVTGHFIFDESQDRLIYAKNSVGLKKPRENNADHSRANLKWRYKTRFWANDLVRLGFADILLESNLTRFHAQHTQVDINNSMNKSQRLFSSRTSED